MRMEKSKVKKSIQLTSQCIDELICEGKNLDFRLDEPQWKNLEIGNVIEFWEDFSGWDKKPCKKSRRVRAQIIDVIQASTFNELMIKCEHIEYNEQEKEKIFQNLRKYWTIEKENEIGVLGLYVKVVN